MGGGHLKHLQKSLTSYLRSFITSSNFYIFDKCSSSTMSSSGCTRNQETLGNGRESNAWLPAYEENHFQCISNGVC